MPYNKTNWKDTIKDASGNVIEKGTPLAAQHLNKMESGIENATQNAEKAVSDLAEVSQQLADTSAVVDEHKENSDIHKPIFVYERLPGLSSHKEGDIIFVYDNLVESTPAFFEQGTISLSGVGGEVTSIFTDSLIRIRSKAGVKVKAGGRYLLKQPAETQTTIHFTDADGVSRATSSGWQTSQNVEFVAPANAYFAYVVIAKKTQEDITPSFVSPNSFLLVEVVK